MDKESPGPNFGLVSDEDGNQFFFGNPEGEGYSQHETFPFHGVITDTLFAITVKFNQPIAGKRFGLVSRVSTSLLQHFYPVSALRLTKGAKVHGRAAMWGDYHNIVSIIPDDASPPTLFERIRVYFHWYEAL